MKALSNARVVEQIVYGVCDSRLSRGGVAGFSIALWCLAVFTLVGCGDGHDHHDHSHADYGHKDHGHKDHGHSHDHDHSGPNPHFWLDPVAMQHAMIAIGPELAKASETTWKYGRFTVVVTIYPLQEPVKLATGKNTDVLTLLPPGMSPHGFELNAQQMRMLSNADVLIVAGGGVDGWATRAVKSVKRKVKVIDINHLLKGKKLEGVSKTGLPEHSFSTGVAAVVEKLSELDTAYAKAFKDVKAKELVTFHNAFDLLAKRYGLTVVAHLTEVELSGGGEVSPSQMREVQAEIKAHHLKVLYAEPQFSDRAVAAIKQATGVAVLRLDPLGTPNKKGYDGYFAMMKSNLKVLVDGQSR
jgi:zinc transport system substrate-binding protein